MSIVSYPETGPVLKGIMSYEGLCPNERDNVQRGIMSKEGLCPTRDSVLRGIVA